MKKRKQINHDHLPSRSSNLVLVHGSVEAGAEGSKEILEGVANDREELADCSGYDQQIGAKLCWSLQYPNASRVPESPFYPLTGPSKLQVVLHKIDPTLTSYQMRYTWERRPVRSYYLLLIYSYYLYSDSISFW